MADTGEWPGTEQEALAVQQRLRGLVDVSGPGPRAALVAGVDVAYDDAAGRVAAAAVLLDAATLEVVEEATALGRVRFPYVPGLLAFREIPALLDALGALRRTPDLVVCDGYGVAHPRRLGLASHLGVVTGLPSFGVAKTPFCYDSAPPGEERGAWTPLLDGTETVGCALRTRRGVKPVFVSAGHRTDLAYARERTLELTPEYRLPQTTRLADRLCRRALSSARPAGS